MGLIRPMSDHGGTLPITVILSMSPCLAVADPDDNYFARVLAYGPDPLLAADLLPQPLATEMLPEATEPALPIDPEPVRQIFSGQSADYSGLDAMTESAVEDLLGLLGLPATTPLSVLAIEVLPGPLSVALTGPRGRRSQVRRRGEAPQASRGKRTRLVRISACAAFWHVAAHRSAGDLLALGG